ncbi:MAG TPA: pantetheine-phosphate adenylyltransferase [bacterium]|nr:pantetheine-phosphate adenylyltransferase [bacterium]
MRENRLAIALYPGSFDPVHNGHLDIIERARRMFRRVVVGVATNIEKDPMFSVADRVAMLRAAAEQTDVEVMQFQGLTVEFAERLGATVIVKGLRAMMDFEYELKMAAMNKRLRPEIETVFMMTAPEFAYLSSTLIREVARFGGSVSGLIPQNVEKRLGQKLRSQRKR